MAAFRPLMILLGLALVVAAWGRPWEWFGHAPSNPPAIVMTDCRRVTAR